MKMFIKPSRICRLLAVISGLLLTSAGIHAAMVWNAPQYITGDSDVSTAGTLVYAYGQFGTAGTTINGVTFANGLLSNANLTLANFTASAAYSSASSPFSGLSSAYQALVGSGIWGSASVTSTVTMNHLTPGTNYQVQFWLDDSRGGYGGRAETFTDGNTSAAVDYNSDSAAGSLGQYVTGNFTATGTTETITLIVINGGLGAAQLNALQLREVSAPASSSALAFLPPVLSTGQVTLSWTGGGQLLWASNVVGPWTAITPAPSSPYSESIAINQNRFYRLQATDSGSDEFIGPLAGWDSVKSYGAVGDGTNDDTAAIRSALNVWGTAGHSTVLFIPAGIYKISSTLYAANQSGCELLGDSPATTKFVWSGASGGTMLDLNDVSSTRIGRFTVDGQNSAGNGMWLWCSNSISFQNDVEDVVFTNTAIGLQFCNHPGEVSGDQNFIADCPIERCAFLHCTTAGLQYANYNTLDLPVWYCLFDHCGIGVSTGVGYGGGNMQVYYSVFRYSSQEDMAMIPEAYNSVRGNYSIGSSMFVESGWSGHNTCNATIEDNVVLDCTNTPVSIQDNGPVMLIDNAFRYSRTPVVYVGTDTNADVVSVSNLYCVASPFNTYPRLRRLDDQTVSTGSITNSQPTLPSAPPNNKAIRYIYELSSAATDVDIQNAINSAYANYNGQKAVVHIPAGSHLINNTITIPGNSDVQLIGDGMNNSLGSASSLEWNAGYSITSTIVSIAAPSRATIRDLFIGGPYENNNTSKWPARGVAAAIADVPGDRVHLDQVSILDRIYVTNQWSHLLLYGISNSFVDVNGLYLNIGGESLGDGVEVYGGGSAGSAWGGGRVFLMPVNSGAFSNTVYKIYGNPHLVVEDAWFESHPDFQPRFMDFTDSGTFTMQGCLESPATDTTSGPYTNLDVTPGIDVSNFSGNISFLNVVHGHNPPYSTNTTTHAVSGSPHPTFTAIESNATSACNLLMLANNGDDTGNGWTKGVWFNNDSSLVNYGFLNNQHTINAGGSQPDAQSGNANVTFLRTMLNQARTEKTSPWPLAPTPAGATDLRFSRVTIMNACSLPFVVYGTNSGFH